MNWRRGLKLSKRTGAKTTQLRLSLCTGFVRLVLDKWAEVGVALSWEVPLAGSFAKQYTCRYCETGDPIQFDRAVLLARNLMPCYLPYAGDGPPANAGLPDVRDYELLAVDAMRKGRLPELIEQSRENPVAFQALQALLEYLLSTQKPVPPELNSWGLDVAAGTLTIPRLGPGRSPYANQVRNEVIVRVVRTLVGCGLTATRNEASNPESACDAVSQALKAQEVELTYDGVAKVMAKGNRAPDGL